MQEYQGCSAVLWLPVLVTQSRIEGWIVFLSIGVCVCVCGGGGRLCPMFSLLPAGSLVGISFVGSDEMVLLSKKQTRTYGWA